MPKLHEDSLWIRQDREDGGPGDVDILYVSGTDELVDLHPSDTNQAKWISQGRRASGRSMDWWGTETAGECRKVLKGEERWSAGAAIFDECKGEIAPPPKVRSIRREFEFADDGDELDADRLYGGELDLCFRRQRRRVTPQDGAAATVRVVMAWGTECGFTAKQYMWAGITATLLVDMLEEAGYSVELLLCAGYHNGNPGRRSKPSVQMVPIKQYDEPLDIDRVLAWTGLAGSFRMHGFKALDHHPEASSTFYGTYGRMTTPDGRDVHANQWGYEAAFGKVADDPSLVYVPAIRERAQAEKFLAATAGRFGLAEDDATENYSSGPEQYGA